MHVIVFPILGELKLLCDIGAKLVSKISVFRHVCAVR